MTDVVMPGGTTFTASGGPLGVLLLHGFTGTTTSVLGLAHLCAAAGYSVMAPLLPGHGTSVEDLMTTGWDDWSGTAESAYQDLAARCDRVAVVGLSMGGSLAVHLAVRHDDIAALVLINPIVMPLGAEMEEMGQALLDAGVEVYDSIGSDIKKEGVVETSYDQTPVAPGLSLLRALKVLNTQLELLSAPTLLLSSTEDHVVPVENGEELVARVRAPLSRIMLENSYHVATLDNDRDVVEAASMAHLAEHLGRSPRS